MDPKIVLCEDDRCLLIADDTLETVSKDSLPGRFNRVIADIAKVYPGAILVGAAAAAQYISHSYEPRITYDVDVILPEHFGAAVGEEARSYLPRAIEAAKKERAMMEDSYRRTRDIDKSRDEIMSILGDDAPAPFVSDELRSAMVGQTLRFIAAKIMEE